MVIEQDQMDVVARLAEELDIAQETKDQETKVVYRGEVLEV